MAGAIDLGWMSSTRHLLFTDLGLNVDVEPSVDLPPSRPAPGQLGIREQRTWATWQLASAALVAALIGMIIGYSGKKPARAAAGSSSSGIISLYGAGGAPKQSTVTRPATSTTNPTSGVSTGITTTTEATTATTVVVPTTATNTNITTLMPNTTGKGPSDLPTFKAGPAWNIGWAFSCVNAPGAAAAFSITAVPANGGSSPAVVSQNGRGADGVTPQTTAGEFHLHVTTDPACIWAIKITGIAG